MSSETKWTKGPWEYSSGGIWAITPWNARVRILEVGTFSPMNVVDSAANAHCAKAAPKLYEALAALTDWHEWSLEQSERAADEFKRDTGFLAPFKDAPGDMENFGAVSAWREWYATEKAKRIAAARTALASARGEG